MKNLIKSIQAKKVTAKALALSLMIPAQSFAVTYDGNDKKQTNQFIESRLLDNLPFVFTIPKNRQVELSEREKAKLQRSGSVIFDYRHSKVPNSGLRLFFGNNSPRDRQKIMAELKDLGLLKSGDVVLKFHPEWGFTGGYPTVMAGISHAGYIYEKGNKVYNADMPLNAGFNQDLRDSSEPSSLSSSVWQKEAHFVHILRPKKNKMSDAAIKNAAGWAHRLVTKRGSVYPGKICFNSNYLVPGFALNPKFSESYKAARSLEDKITLLTAHSKEIGAIASGDREITTWLDSATLGGNQRPGFKSQVCVFCSDFAWSLAALGSCEFNSRNPSVRSCDPKPLFAPIPVIGNGPVTSSSYVPGVADLAYLILTATDTNPGDASRFVAEAFAATKPMTNISSGHRAAAQTIPNELYKGLVGYTQLLLQGNTSEASRVRAGIKQQMDVPDNYSPNAFLVNAVMPDKIGGQVNPNKAYDYVATIAFPSASVTKKVARLAKDEREGGEVIVGAGPKALPEALLDNPSFSRNQRRCSGVVNWGNGPVPSMGPLGYGDCQDFRRALSAIDSDWESYVNDGYVYP